MEQQNLLAQLDIARRHLACATREMASAAAALEAAAASAQGDASSQLALIAEVVSTQKDLAAGLATLVKSAPSDMVDILLASVAFARSGDAAGRH